MDEDDFLWNCALLDKDSDSTLFLVPGILDEPKHFLNLGHPSIDQTYSLILDDRSESDLSDVTLSIPVVEIRGNGVLDTIGGEIWEASLLLCAFVLLQPHLFLHGSVMELGSGLGLPGLLVSQLQSFIRAPSKREVCLSDNDPRCVENLINLVKRCERNLEHVEEFHETSNVMLSIVDLDWSSYAKQQNENLLCDNYSTHSVPDNGNTLAVNQETKLRISNNLLDNQRFQLLMGSALCYSPYHSCLADTALHFLQGRCEELIVIQIGDRAGFSLFLSRMTDLQIEYTVEEIPSIVYDSAQLIGHSQSPSVDDIQPSRLCTSSDENEVMSEKMFYFPPHMVRRAIRICRDCSVESDTSAFFEDGMTESGHRTYPLDAKIITNLIRTDRESFKIVRAKLKQKKALVCVDDNDNNKQS